MAASATIQIRSARTSDAVAIARLSEQLGYPVDPLVMSRNLQLTEESHTAMVFVSLSNDAVTGWIYLIEHTDLTSGPYGEIAGLVVDEAHRGKRIGKKLVEYVINTCQKKGLSKIRVRSQLKREGAHRFYTGLGFCSVKEQKVFDLPIK